MPISDCLAYLDELELNSLHVPRSLLWHDSYYYFSTSNPLFTNTWYKEKNCYNDNLTGTKPLLKRWQLNRNYARTLYLYFKKHIFWIFVRIAPLKQFYQISKTYVLWGNNNKTSAFLDLILLIKDSLQQHIHSNGNTFGNKCCQSNEGPLYTVDPIYHYTRGPRWNIMIFKSRHLPCMYHGMYNSHLFYRHSILPRHHWSIHTKQHSVKQSAIFSNWNRIRIAKGQYIQWSIMSNK